MSCFWQWFNNSFWLRPVRWGVRIHWPGTTHLYCLTHQIYSYPEMYPYVDKCGEWYEY